MKELKTYLLSALLLLSPALMASTQKALEIQCHSPLEGLDIVFKRSPETGRAYALLLSTEKLESYAFLEEAAISQEDASSFRFQSEEITIEVDLELGSGSIEIDWPQFSESPIALNDCLSTVED